jgi:hypothetical protein
MLNTASLNCNLIKILEQESYPINASALANKLGLDSAKDVNPALYKLEKAGTVVKNSRVIPPTWSINTNKIIYDRTHITKLHIELKNKIIDILKNEVYPVDANYIFDQLNDNNNITLSHINSILYTSATEGIITKIPNSPPLWHIEKNYSKDELLLLIVESLEKSSVDHLLAVRHFAAKNIMIN